MDKFYIYSTDPMIEASALGLLLSTGLVTGSVHTVLQVAKKLSATDCRSVLPPLVMELLNKYIALDDEYNLSVPNDTVSKLIFNGIEFMFVFSLF